MNASIEAPKKARPEAELQALTEDGYTNEVVNGELVMSPVQGLGVEQERATSSHKPTFDLFDKAPAQIYASYGGR